MYYIPTIPKDLTLTGRQSAIKEGEEFKNLFLLCTRMEKVVFQKGKTLLQYNYCFTRGVDKDPLFSVTVADHGKIIEYNCEICNDAKYCHHLEKAIEEIQNDYQKCSENPEWAVTRKQFIEEKEQEELNRLQEEERQSLRNESLSQISSLVEVLNKHDVLPLSTQVTIEPTLELNQDYRGITATLSIKIGIDKMYQISNIQTFLELVKQNEEHTYGKQLSFKHSLSNFDEPAQKLVKILMAQTKKDSRIFTMNNREVMLDSDSVEELILSYQGRALYLSLSDHSDIQPYTVTLDPVMARFALSKEYQLQALVEPGGFLYSFRHHDFYLKNHNIYLLSFPDPAMRSLYDFIRGNSKFSFRHIKDVLTKEILARFYQHIDIAEEIKAEISLKDFTIEAYFDYDGEAITLESRYLYDSHPITETEISENRYTNLKAEKYNLLLRSLGIETARITEEGKIFQFLKTDLTALQELASVFISEKLARLQARTYQPIRMNLSYQTNILSVCLEESGYTDEELSRIIRGLRKKQKYIRLKNNVILEIDEEAGEKLLNTVEEFNLDPHALNKVQEIPLYQALKLKDASADFLDAEKSSQLTDLIKDIADYKNAGFILPESLNPVMRSYQKEAFQWMKTLIKYNFGGILADDMGLGKTLEMISVLESDHTEAPSLIVCPKSLTFNWKNEFDRWSANLGVIPIVGDSSTRKDIISQINNQERKIYVTSYDSLRNDIEEYDSKEFCYAVLDEAQYIKNHDTQKAQSVKTIHASHRFVLTGTPIENSVMDLWSLFDFLMPGYLNSMTEFRSRYERLITQKKNADIIQTLIRKVAPFILRRVKQDVIEDLPEKTELVHTAKMTSGQRLIYEAELKRTRDILQFSDNKLELLSCLTRLRQICVDPGMYLENYEDGSGKVTLALELIEELIAAGHRIVLFSQFASIFKTLSPELEARNIPYYLLTGKTSAESRVAMATDFNISEEKKIFLVSLKAGGTGLNLIGADTVIHLDPWWNAAAENQATDRTHRIGQKKVVTVMKLVAEDSIEQKVIELQERKKEIVKMIVADDDSLIRKMTNEDIGFLLSE